MVKALRFRGDRRLKMARTLALIHVEGGVYGISFPDFPGCVSTANSLEEALERGAQALALHVEGMVEDGEKLPVLSNADQLRVDPALAEEMRDAILASILVEMPTKAVRLNISMDEALLARLDRAAASVGQSRSAFLAEAVRQRIAASVGRSAA
jgi:predicted RNase H-like HicB family nuclease